MAKRGDFYEEDEPIEKLTAAYEHGRPFVTAPPVQAGWGQTQYVEVPVPPASSLLNRGDTWAALSH